MRIPACMSMNELPHETRSGPGIAVNNVFDIGPEKAILLCEPIILNLFQHLVVVFNTLIISRKLCFYLYNIIWNNIYGYNYYGL